ncbi:MAG: DevR family CRISPR-associated autoregulator [Thermofilum sp.]
MVFVSVRGRIWLQAEAMNMVETVGNYVKHRKVPVMVREGDSYLTFFVPAVSGESIAHAYQVTLAEELAASGDSVCPLCSRGIFLKSTNKVVFEEAIGVKLDEKLQSLLKSSGEEGSEGEGKAQKGAGKGRGSKKSVKPEDLINACAFIEESILKKCGVEDVGGFLFAEEPLNVKRTSSFSTGYMIPVREALGLVSVDPQMHTRYALGTKFVSVEEAEGERRERAAGQMIYVVEVSSALFSFSFDIDTSLIGKYAFITSKYGSVVSGVDPVRRSRAALTALKRFLIEFPVGAKRTRFNPSDLRWDSIAIAVSDGVFTVPSSFTADYLRRAVEKRKHASRNTVIYAYSEGCEAGEGVSCFGSPEDAIANAIDDALKRVSRG